MIPFDFQLWESGDYKCIDTFGNPVNVHALNDKARIHQPVIRTINGNGIEEYITRDNLYLVKK